MPIILVDILKFAHLLLALSIFGSVLYCFAAMNAKNPQYFTRINKILLLLGILATITGTLLVYPKHFTFHTPWIQAAYLLIAVFTGAILLLISLRKVKHYPLISRFVYLLLILLLVGVVHDAVTKVTFLL